MTEVALGGSLCQFSGDGELSVLPQLKSFTAFETISNNLKIFLQQSNNPVSPYMMSLFIKPRDGGPRVDKTEDNEIPRGMSEKIFFTHNNVCQNLSLCCLFVSALVIYPGGDF